MIKAYGKLVDEETRCIHYHGKNDIIALQCYKCKKYYACYKCHDGIESHPFSPYPISLSDDFPILCGVCKNLLTYQEYHNHTNCPYCLSDFNPGCQNHHDYYFKSE